LLHTGIDASRFLRLAAHQLQRPAASWDVAMFDTQGPRYRPSSWSFTPGPAAGTCLFYPGV